MDIANLLWFLVPNAKFTMSGNNYSDVSWTDERTQPTLKELETALPAYQTSLQTTRQNKIDAKQAVLDKLGLTADEVAVLFG